MLYPKNVPHWERVIRFIVSVVLIIVALSNQAAFGGSSIVPILLIGSGIFLTATAFIGWCPACALVGRKLKKNQPKASL